MSQEGYETLRKAIEWLKNHVSEPEKTSVACACFELDGGITILCAQHLVEVTLKQSVSNSDTVSIFIEQLEEVKKVLNAA